MKKRNLVILIFSFAMHIACSSKNEDTLEHRVVLYSRDVGGINYSYRFFDCLTITNYVNNSFTVKELYKIALKYLDTAKGDLPIGAVTFIGQAPGSTLPPATSDYIEEQKKLEIITFGFKTNPKKLDTKPKPQLSSIRFTINGHSNTWFNDGLSKKAIEALLASDEPWDTTKLPIYHRQKNK